MLAQHIKLGRNFFSFSFFYTISLGNKNLDDCHLSLIRLTFADLNSFIKTHVITKSKELKSDLINW